MLLHRIRQRLVVRITLQISSYLPCIRIVISPLSLVVILHIFLNRAIASLSILGIFVAAFFGALHRIRRPILLLRRPSHTRHRSCQRDLHLRLVRKGLHIPSPQASENMRASRIHRMRRSRYPQSSCTSSPDSRFPHRTIFGESGEIPLQSAP